MPISSPQQLLVHELHAIEDAENQASQAIQQVSSDVENGQVRQLVERRLEEGKRILQDVQKCLEQMNGQSGRVQNDAARGLIAETRQMLKEVSDPELKQAVLIGGMQKLEHYCIATWGTVKAMARQTGEQELAEAMDRALQEGYAWDEEMTKIAESRVNPAALQEGDQTGGNSSRQGSSQSSGQSKSEADDLKAREYRGDDGKIHHHTREYMKREGN